jgi:signal transduction histidine kinase
LHIIGVPIKMHNTIAGCLVACTAPGMAPFSREDYALISTAARQFSTALQNAILYEQAQRREALRGEMLRQVVAAQENERQRIARELHDGPGQTLTGLGLGLAATEARFKTDPEIAIQQLTELRALNATTLQELRDIIVDLRPSVLDDLGLIPALRSQVHQLEQRTGASVVLDVTGNRRRLDPQLETIVFRIVQEALTNIVKHAHATKVTVQVTYSDEALALLVADNGAGFDVSRFAESSGQRQSGWGLMGIQERVALAAGSCTIESQPGEGTRVYAQLPLADTL